MANTQIWRELRTLTSMSKGKRFFRALGIISIIILAAVIAMIVFRLSYAFQVLSFSSEANEPTIKAGQVLFTSNLKQPKRYDFIAFKNNTEPGSSIWIFRVCGIAGDSVEIRDGNLYVNNIAADSSLTLSHSYIIAIHDTANLSSSGAAIPVSDTTAMVIVADDEIKQKGIPYSRYTLPVDVTDARIQKIFGEPWNIDHFGPVRVPKDSYFLLGDSRTNAVDSRYIGFINKKDFRGTLLSN